MMSRRGRSGPTISLFSFQDIITSVTAIVTVVTLLLALDLVQRKPTSAKASSQSLATKLTDRIAAIEFELAALRQAAESTDKLVQELAAQSPGELKSEIAQRTTRIAELEREVATLETQRTAWQEREKVELAEQFDLSPLRERIAQSRDTIAKRQQELESERATNRTVYSLPRGFQKEGWLAIIDEKSIAVAPLGRPAQPVHFAEEGSLLRRKSAARAFVAWVDQMLPKSAYILLLVRPDAADAFNEVQASLATRSVSYGFDLVGAEEVLLHPERGAAP